MIRHSALIPLSHDHHLGLMAAQRLKRGDTAYKRSSSIEESVAELWRTELADHFEQEERFLFAVETSDEIRAMIRRAIDEHARIRDLVERIGRGEEVAASARELGTLLDAHIRFEERELFERMQTTIDERVLNETAAAMASVRTARTCSNDTPGH